MSRRSAKTPAPAPAGGSATTSSTGSREFTRRARAARQRTAQKQTRRKQTAPKSSLQIRETLRRIPRAAWICALIACLNAACWSIVTPPFQAVDEPSHFAYTQQLAENERLPTSSEFRFSPDEQAALTDLRKEEISGWPAVRATHSSKEQRVLERDLGAHLARHGSGGAGGAASSPPLYYLLETIPYGLASAGTLLDQLELMRLLSALLAGLTALFVFLFLREALPAVPWAWTVGGLGVALAPLLGYISGAVNPDSLLFAVSAAIFYCLARAFRRGLTRRLAVAIGALMAAGFLTKLNFIGLAPGIVLGLVVLAARVSRVEGRREALRSLGTALAIAASPVCIYVLANLLSGNPALGAVSDTLRSRGSIFHELSYTWQYFLPRLPGMTNYFPGLSTTRQLWFDKSVGVYGWLDTTFPIWVCNLALIPAGLLAILCTRTLVLSRIALRQRLTEVIVYGTMGLGLMLLIGASAYFNTEAENLGFAEPRYLAPMLPLVGVALALAARGAGRRWGPPVGALIVVLFLAHNIFSQLLVIARFYS